MTEAQVGNDLGLCFRGSPDGIRTRATALRGRRARPLHNGATAGTAEELYPSTAEGDQSGPSALRRAEALGYLDSNQD
jgi:hypothetical protein